MSLTDQEQVILKAIERLAYSPTSPVLISDVIKAVGYPKATTKKLLVRLAEKGIVAVHRHDYPASLTPAERRLMLRLRDGRGNWGYYSAVSMRARNPKKSKGKAALKRAGKALKGFAQGALSAGSEILGAGAMALNPVRRKVRNKYIDLVIKGQAKKTPQGWKVGQKTFAQGRGTVNVSSGYYLDKATGLVYAKRERNAAKKRKRNVEQGFYDASGFHPIRASSDYSEGQRPSRSKRAKTVKRKAAATASHKRKVSSRKATARRLASRAVSKTVKSRRRRNISEGFYDASGAFHPIRSASDYSPAAAGETGHRPIRTRSKKRRAAKSKAASTARTKAGVRARKATTSRLAGRAIRKSAGLLKGKRRNPDTLYVERSGGKWVAWTYSEGRRYQVTSSYEKRDIAAFAKRKGYQIVWVNPLAHGRQVVGAARRLARKGHSLAQIVAKLKRSYTGLDERTLRSLASNVIAESKRNPSSKVITKRITTYRTRPIGQYLFSGGMEYFYEGHSGRMGGYKTLAETKAAIDEEARKIDEYRKSRGVKIKPPRNAPRRERKNPSAESIRKKFAGSVSGSRDLYFPKGTPTGLAKLGKLVLIQTEEGTIKPVSGTAWLCADTNEKLHIGSTTNSPLFSGPARSFGKVTKVEYESSKPHLGYRGPIIWFHRVGEENGIRPTLRADGKGGLVFRGGDYRLTSRGIEN